MTDMKTRTQDCYLQGVSTNNVTPGKIVTGIKGASERTDATKRTDAFAEFGEKADRCPSQITAAR